MHPCSLTPALRDQVSYAYKQYPTSKQEEEMLLKRCHSTGRVMFNENYISQRCYGRRFPAVHSEMTDSVHLSLIHI